MILLDNRKVANVFNNYFQTERQRERQTERDRETERERQRQRERLTNFVTNFLNDLSSNKAAGGNIPLNLLQESILNLSCLVRYINETSVKSKFPDYLNCRVKCPCTKKTILLIKKIQTCYFIIVTIKSL